MSEALAIAHERKTATTRHVMDVIVTVDGDEGPSADDLQQIIKRALFDAGMKPIVVDATDDIGLGTENVIVHHDAESADPTVLALNELTLFRLEGGDVMLEF